MPRYLDDDLAIFGLQGRSRDEEDMVGWHQEILGDEILGAGAASTAAIQGGADFRSALAQRYARRAPIVQKVNPTKKRRWIMGFGPTPIPPTSTVTVQSQPQLLFRGEKLLNTGDGAGLFIQGLFVGQKSQLPTFQAPISVLAFATGALDNELMMDTADPALFITFQIQNTTAATLTWSMALVGHAVL